MKSNSLRFVLMARGKGNKPSLKNIKVPIESGMGQMMLSRQDAEQRERERLNKLTLHMSERQAEEEQQQGKE